MDALDKIDGYSIFEIIGNNKKSYINEICYGTLAGLKEVLPEYHDPERIESLKWLGIPKEYLTTKKSYEKNLKKFKKWLDEKSESYLKDLLGKLEEQHDCDCGCGDSEDDW